MIYRSLIVILAIAFTSCNQQKNIAYYQNIEGQTANSSQTSYDPTIQPDDLLLIIVSAEDAEAAAPFNLESAIVPTMVGQSSIGQRQHQMYLVDKNGTIEFPVLGTLNVVNKTKTEIVRDLKNRLAVKYIKNPIVNLRIMNFKITVQGEVTRPGSYPINSERITLPEALSMAGDLTIYGKRNNVIVIREVEHKKSVFKVDMTKAEFINSPVYYLKQNDLVYVEPNAAKANSSTFNQNIPVWISLSSVLISLVLLFKK